MAPYPSVNTCLAYEGLFKGIRGPESEASPGGLEGVFPPEIKARTTKLLQSSYVQSSRVYVLSVVVTAKTLKTYAENFEVDPIVTGEPIP
jgi:hypothetical protein